MILRSLIVLLVFSVMSLNVAAEVVVVEADDSLPVPVDFVLSWKDESWLKDRLQGKKYITQKSVYKSPDHRGDDSDRWTFTAIPGTNQKTIPDVIFRNRSYRCIVMTMRGGEEKITDLAEFDCAMDTQSVVKARANCAAQGGTWDAWYEPKGVCVTDNRERCYSRGGEWDRICLSGSLKCVLPYPDGGKECTDSSQCLGGCLDVRNKPDGEGKVSGQCRKTDNPCGCFGFIENGKRSEKWKCVD